MRITTANGRFLGRRQRFVVVATSVLALLAVCQWWSPTGLSPRAFAAEADTTAEANTAEAIDLRLKTAIEYLAADERDGRGIGTEGIDEAADYIAEQFQSLGLRTDVFEGKPFQVFTMTTGATLGEPNTLSFVHAGDGDEKHQAIELALDSDFTPMALGGSGPVDMPVAFVGYGISATDEGYDDYAEIDVEGKAVIVMRHEPQQDNPHSAFDGTRDSSYAPLTRKISNAYEHGAAAVIFCTDEHALLKSVKKRQKSWSSAIKKLADEHAEFVEIENPTLEQFRKHEQDVRRLTERINKFGEKVKRNLDPLMKFEYGGSADTSRDIFVFHVHRQALDRVLKASLQTDLSTLEQRIDEGPTPQSHELPGWRIQGEVSIDRTDVEVKNVAAILEGEGPHANETIIIGAHYDHVGYGGPNSLAPGSTEVHNGADDNGSGTVVLLEVARALAARPEKLPRRIMFIAFTAEERGLIGSARYTRDPALPLEDTVAMLNMDMVGRLNEDGKLLLQGYDTATEFEPLLDRLNETYGFDIKKTSGGFGPSDHSSFYAKQIPVMHFFTGIHSDYHRPGDDVEKLNVEGMRRIGQMVADVAVALAEAEDRPTFVSTGGKSTGASRDGDRPYFGSIPDFGQEDPGYALSGVAKDSPAEKAGLQGGDAIIKLGDSRIGNLDDFDSALRKYEGGDTVEVVVKRDDEEVTLKVTLGPPR